MPGRLIDLSQTRNTYAILIFLAAARARCTAADLQLLARDRLPLDASCARHPLRYGLSQPLVEHGAAMPN